MRNWVVVSLIALLTAGCSAAVAAADRSEKAERWMTATIVAVDAKAMTLSVRNEVSGGAAEEIAFQVDPGATVRIHGLRGKLDQLKVGDVVTVKHTVREGKRVALEIQHM